jgi:hypothetical protein
MTRDALDRVIRDHYCPRRPTDDELVKALNDEARRQWEDINGSDHVAHCLALAADRLHDLQPQPYRMSSDEIRAMREIIDDWNARKAKP